MKNPHPKTDFFLIWETETIHLSQEQILVAPKLSLRRVWDTVISKDKSFNRQKLMLWVLTIKRSNQGTTQPVTIQETHISLGRQDGCWQDDCPQKDQAKCCLTHWLSFPLYLGNSECQPVMFLTKNRLWSDWRATSNFQRELLMWDHGTMTLQDTHTLLSWDQSVTKSCHWHFLFT